MNVFVATLLRLSYSGGFVILGVMILRIVLRGVPKQSRLILWALAGLRLLIPLFVPSSFSIVPEPERIIADREAVRQATSMSEATLTSTELLFVPSPKKQTKNAREKPNEKNDKYNMKLLYPTVFIPRFA